MLEARKKENEKYLDQVKNTIESEGVRFINLQFTDILGVVKSITIPASQFDNSLQHGAWFDGSSIEGFTRIAESDMFLFPDLSTFRVIPWTEAEARVICWVFTPEREHFEGDPRWILKKALNEAKDMGYEYKTGPELEFFLFNKKEGSHDLKPLPHDLGGYFDYSTDLASEVRKDMVDALEAMGIEVEASHHEVATGQHEIGFRYGNALSTADNAITFKYTLKAIAHKHGLHATFMPKPISGINGSGMHVHQSLFKDGENMFTDVNGKHGLSKIAQSFVAGLLKNSKGMACVIAPTVNSYKRLVPGYEAPVYVCWGQTNRSALIRVPRLSQGITSATRVELRCPDPSCNPYLAFAVMLKSGLDGIKNNIEAPTPVEGDMFELGEEGRKAMELQSLPGSLGEAIVELKKNELVQSALGKHLLGRFITAKTQEWDEYRIQVSKWELDRYLPTI